MCECCVLHFKFNGGAEECRVSIKSHEKDVYLTRMRHLRFRRHFVSLKAFLLLREELYGQIYEAPKYVFVCQKHL